MKFQNSDIISVKSLYPIYKSGKGHFRIGAQVDITIDIDDPDCEFWDLAHLLDGKNDFAKVVQLMQKRHPNLSADDVEMGVLELDKLRFVEHARHNEFDDELSPLYRYEGNVNYYSHFCHLDDDKADLQRILLTSRVVLLGLGGIGSNILPVLASVGIGHITCVDYAVVDLSNLNRQYLFRESDIGNLKTAAA